VKIELKLDHSTPVPGQPLELRALLRITGDALPDDAPGGRTRNPMKLALVLDRSGSMSGAKLHYLREAAALVLRRLRSDDAVSVVTYDSDVGILAANAVGPAAHNAAVTAVNSIQPGGMTNLSGGWLQGRELLAAGAAGAPGAPGAPGPGGTEGATGTPSAGSPQLRRLILMTDGLANQGITSPGALRGLCATAAAQGIVTTTIGFGADFNEDLLRAMAEAGGGATWYVENPDQAPGIFEEELEGLLGLAAQNVTVTVRPSAAVQFTALRHGYPQAPVEGGVAIQVGDLYAKEPRLALMEFLLPAVGGGAGAGQGAGEGAGAGDIDEEREVARIEVAGHVIREDGGVEHRVVSLPVRFRIGEAPRVDAEVQQTVLLLEGARARDEAMERQARGDWRGAAQVLREARDLFQELGDSPEADREAEDLDLMADRVEANAGFDAMDAKYMKQRAWDDRRSRASAKELYSR
jgi:Ca-activated chloride channel homolog